MAIGDFMDNRIEKIFEMLNTGFNEENKDITIGKVHEEMFIKYWWMECPEEYKDYTIRDFLALYKLEYLEDHKILEMEVIEKLRELVYKLHEYEQEYHNLYKEIIDEESRKRANFLIEQINGIRDLLEEYNLVNNSDELKEMYERYLEQAKFPNENIIENIKKKNLML